jgi:hypothetical protein
MVSDPSVSRFSGLVLPIRERIAELDRSNEASGIIQGKHIRWITSTADHFKDENHGSVGKTVLSGENDAGDLIFSGIEYFPPCLGKRRPVPFAPPIPIEPRRFDKANNRGRLIGMKEISPDEFGPSMQYRLELRVRAKFSPGMSHYPVQSFIPCDDIRMHTFYLPAIAIIETSDGTRLGSDPYSSIDIFQKPEFIMDLHAFTDFIDINSRFPGQSIKFWFSIAGKTITLNEITIIKAVL